MRPTFSLLKRSIWKGPNLVPFPNLRPGEKGHVIRTQARAASIMPFMVGLKFSVHNGKTYSDVYVTEDMVGRKLGEFVPTRKRFTYKLSKNK
ncbi:37S ribosomal protein S19, mitochondrial [Exophiala mesophila]|uniref:37S ribosomal protein S19, mitochondrial n=1 Tax=Exophiala mesophila TaxID=212818 RepID=A0A0D1ZGM8_EXOME|nr:uncharacterized protein PV10_05031 [Exophiala mesophila]KIV93847.1 hypothetical protein PV10_05031 [Exophiala mesophila]RVX66854.1 37S ribosomal protein S19, mitochondrial [Exophiala mesophila]